MPPTREEIIYAVRQYYEKNKVSPKIKDINDLPFSRKSVQVYFKTWNNMLRHADIPLNRNPPRLLECAACLTMFTRQVKEIKKVKISFCSRACNAMYYTLGRKHTQETKDKISASLKAHRVFT